MSELPITHQREVAASRCSYKFRNIQGKATVLESPFNSLLIYTLY